MHPLSLTKTCSHRWSKCPGRRSLGIIPWRPVVKGARQKEAGGGGVQPEGVGRTGAHGLQGAF